MSRHQSERKNTEFKLKYHHKNLNQGNRIGLNGDQFRYIMVYPKCSRHGNSVLRMF